MFRLSVDPANILESPRLSRVICSASKSMELESLFNFAVLDVASISNSFYNVKIRTSTALDMTQHARQGQ